MRFLILIFLIITLTSCASITEKKYDYSNFRANMPTSILVIPPENASLEVGAGNNYLSIITMPISERGYYVFPVELVSSYFKENGLSAPEDILKVTPQKLQKIFGTDAIFYVKIKKWGSSYKVLNSETTVEASGKLVDAKTGKLLWEGVQSSTTSSGINLDLTDMVVSALVNQVANNVQDLSHDLARRGAFETIYNNNNGFLEGPLKIHRK